MIARIFLFSTLLCMLFSVGIQGDEVIWSGDVSSDGSPSRPVQLVLGQEYKIKASGFVNLGKWVQAGEKLGNDACYAFNSKTHLEKIASLRNSGDISIGDSTYHLDHVYESAPFTAKQNKIHFWVSDTDYEGNTGAFKVEIVRIQKGK